MVTGHAGLIQSANSILVCITHVSLLINLSFKNNGEEMNWLMACGERMQGRIFHGEE